MKSLWDFLLQWWGSFRPWVLVQPWEQGLRTRLGRSPILLGNGLHFRFPVIDRVYVQGVRRRASSLQMQTLTTSDGKVALVWGTLLYEIGDVVKLYSALDHGEDTLIREAMAAIAQAVRELDASSCGMAEVESAALAKLEFGRYGLEGVELRLTDFAVVRAYRMVTGAGFSTHGAALSTQEAVR